MKLKRWNEANFSSASFYSATEGLAISELFLFTPRIEELLQPDFGCQVRYPRGYLMDRLSTRDCLKSFEIIKYFERQYVCYKFIPRIESKKMQIFDYTMSPGFPGQIYKLFLNPNIFSSIREVSIAVHENVSGQFYFSVYSSNVYLPKKELPTIFSSYRELVRVRLKHPYKTGCTDVTNGFNTWFDIDLKQVDNEMISKLNYSIPFVPSFDPTQNHRKLLNYHSFINETIRKTLVAIIARTNFDRTSCRTKFSITDTKLVKEEQFAVVVSWPMSEKINFQYAPEQELIDFVVYVCSCVGIWFGLSAYSMFDYLVSFARDRNVANVNIDQRTINRTFQKRLEMNDKRMFLITQYVKHLHNIIPD